MHYSWRMCWIIVYDNHGRETGRFHHTELAATQLPRDVRGAIDQARAFDGQHESADFQAEEATGR